MDNRKVVSLRRVVVCALMALLCGLFAGARAETHLVDASGDASAYARAVAGMNRTIQGSGTLRSRSANAGETVLCRTDGRDPGADFPGSDALETLLLGPDGRCTMRFSDAASAELAIDWLNSQAWVKYAERDGWIEAADISFESWAAQSMDMGDYLALAQGWGVGQRTVAVIDSGVWPHELIADKLTAGGYDYVDGDQDTTNDSYGHGTRVAGILADCTRSAPVLIHPIRVLNENGGGLISNVVNAISEACDAGADIINLSLAVRGTYTSLEDMVREAVSRGVVVVIAAGNYGINTSKVSPARVDAEGAIVVGAAERAGGVDYRADYSDFGDSVDVYAYGTNIRCCSSGGGYGTDTGTSMAAPHVSAACALMLLLDPGLSPSAVEARIKLAADHCGGVALKLTPLVPEEGYFSLRSLTLAVGETIPLPTAVFPATCGETFSWSASGGCVRVSESGLLEAVSPGSDALMATCRGLADYVIPVTVLEDGGGAIVLPEGTVSVGEEAFAGSGASRVELPATVQTVGAGAFADCPGLRLVIVRGVGTRLSEDAFDGEDVVLVCPGGSAAMDAALDNGLQYLLLDDQP